MRRTGVTVAVMLTLFTPAALGSTGSEAASKRPSLRFVDLDPLTVRGLNFKPGERVKLLVNADGPHRLAAKASPRGDFTVRLAFKLDRCTAVVVQAIGNKGSRAMVDVTTPDCASVDVNAP
jgi:hypothetical protein